MCGIVYAHSFEGKPVNNGILQQYDKQKHRGQQGFGIFDGQGMHMVHAAKEERILNWLVKYDSNLLLMHHRFPTSTINVKKAAHPFSTKSYFGKNEYILVHNGSIRNTDELYEAHYKQGIRYQSLLPDKTYNDSECLLWDFALFMEGKQKELKAKGAIAFICLEKKDDKLVKMHFGRNNNPLNLNRGKEGITLSSEGEGEPIEQDTLYTWNYKLSRLTKRTVIIPSGWATTGPYTYTGGYRGHEYYRSPNWGRNDDGYWDDEDDSSAAGNWLPAETKKRFSNFLHGNRESYVQDQDTKIYLPALTDSKQEAEDYKSIGEYISDEQEISNTMLQYLTEAHGHFEQAYWEAELDYMDSIENNDVELQMLLEEVMERISSDPDNVNTNSISQEWESLWQQ